MKIKFFLTTFLMTAFLSLLSYDSNAQYDNYSNWISLNQDFKFRYKCDSKPYKGKYQTWFEFMRLDSKASRNESNKYGHVILYIEGYEKPVKISIGSDGDDKNKVWHPFTFDLCSSQLKYKFKTGFSKYSNSSSILN